MNTTLELNGTMDDVMLMAGLVERQPGALEQLYKRYKNVLKSIAMQVLHSENDADEVLQDVMLQVWNRPGKYSAKHGKLISWLATLARRRAIDRVRQHCAYQRATSRFEDEQKSPVGEFREFESVDEAAHAADVSEILVQRIAELPPAQQDIVRMMFYRGMSQREIARATGIPLGTIKTRLKLAMKKLQTSLQSEESAIR